MVELIPALLTVACFKLMQLSRQKVKPKIPAKKLVSKPSEDSDIMWKSTDVGEGSEPCIGSTDGSDMEPPTSVLQSTRVNTSRPGLALGGSVSKLGRNKIPAKQLHQAGNLSGVTDPGQDLVGLADVLNRMSPQDAAVLRSFLDSRETEQHACGEFPDHTSNTSAQPFTAVGSRTSNARNVKRPHNRPQPVTGADSAAEGIKAHLYELSQLDSQRVLTVRKISALGMDSAVTLRAYFSKYGTVERLLVSHPRNKTPHGTIRIRPATVAFIVMSKAEEAQAVLTQAAQAGHSVEGVAITVETFESHPSKEDRDVQDGEHGTP